MPIRFILLFASVFLIAGCGTIGAPPTEGECEWTGTVKDYSDLDGCRWMIVTDEGQQIIPAEVAPPGFVFEDGQRVRFSFEELTDVMDICMAGDVMAHIDCIQLINNPVPVPEPCADFDALDGWLRDLSYVRAPSLVTKYRYRTDGWAYLLTTESGDFLYDCQGTMLCEPGEEDCLRLLEESGEGEVIWRQ